MEFPIVIKKKQALLPFYAVISFIMLCISVLFLFFPFVQVFADAMSDRMLTFYMAAGAVCTLFFSFSFFTVIFGAISPAVGIRLTEKGICDYTVAGVGAGFIPKEAILSLRTFGNKKGRFLGIKIDPKYVDSLSSDRNVRRETDNNISSGLPAVVIRQCDIRMSVNELLRTILEAYSVNDGESREAEAISPDVSEQADAPLIFHTDDLPEAEKPEESPAPSTAKPIPDNPPEERGEDKKSGVSNVVKRPRIKNVDELLAELNIVPGAGEGKAEDKDGGEK